MFTVIFSFLRVYWQTTLIASAILSVLGAFSLQHIEIAHLRRQLLECHGENITLEHSNEALLASIASQNKAIENLQSATQSKINLASQALIIARKKAQYYAARARTIQLQQSSKDECTDLRRLINDFSAVK